MSAAPGTPSWVTDPHIVASPSNDTPSWLVSHEDEIHRSSVSTGNNHGNGELQLTTIQVDGFADPNTTTTTAATTTTTTTMSNTQAARERTWGQFWSNSFRRDGRTLLIAILVIILMNVPYVKWVLYPFTVFSTWIHELCHGLAALMVGGSIQKLQVFPDTSGLATFNGVESKRLAFVASAGYQGTAVIGMLLLQLRRTKRGPRAGTMAVAVMMFLSVALWVRNAFGIAFILALGALLGLSAWRMSSFWIRNLYVLLGVTCALNAITSIQALFGSTHQVNGQDVTTDAHAMADIKGGGSTMWAILWLCLALGLALIGLVFAIPGPDEPADFTLCGMCQDFGCFYICNAKGRRLWTTLIGRDQDSPTDKDTPSNAA